MDNWRGANPSEQRWRADTNYILLLEDDAPNAQLIKALIEGDLAIRVEVVADGVSALNALEAAMPLAVIVDLMVPLLDGEHFMQAVRRRHGWNVHYVVVSALGDSEASAARADARARTKPFEIDALVEAVADAMVPWFAAALDQRPQRGIAEVLRTALSSDAELLIARSWNVLGHAHESTEKSRLLLSLMQLRHDRSATRPLLTSVWPLSCRSARRT